MRTDAGHRSLALLGALLTIACAAGPASAAEFTVNSAKDQDEALAEQGDGACASDPEDLCTLRAAISEANALAGDDVIRVPPGRYVLNVGDQDENCNEEGDLDINHFCSEGGQGDLTIDGTGTTGETIVDANGVDRVFQIFDAVDPETQETYDVTISDLTVTGGWVFGNGGGILNQAQNTLTLDRVRVTRNAAVAAEGGGNGGGVANEAHLEIVESTIDRNNADNDGGGIHNTGELSITRSAINDNAATDDGGGLYNHTPLIICCVALGPEQTEFAPVTIENTTIDGNTADVNLGGAGMGGGVMVNNGAVSFLNATITDNQSFDDGTSAGGIVTGESFASLKNTIVADNRHLGEADNCEDFNLNGISSQGHNLSNTEADDCKLTEEGDKPATEAGLGRLTDNGGPTHTRALLGGSAAIDSADNEECPDTDQRLAERPPPTGSAGPTCDIGAYEATAMADLLIEKLDGPDPATVGGRLTYLLVAENDGPDTANGVTVQDVLPAGVTFLSATPSQGSCSGTSTVTCDLGTLAAGTHATVEIAVRPDETGTKTNTATIGAAVTDPDTSNNTDSATTEVQEAGPGVVPQGPCTGAPPRTSISRNSLHARRNTLRFTGRAVGFLCLEGSVLGGVTRVRLAIAKRTENGCRFLNGDGELEGARRCGNREFIPARLGPERNGKVPWVFRIRGLDLPPGIYVVVAFAVDRQGTRETRLRKMNIKHFRVR